VAATHVGNKAAEDDADDNDKGWKYSSLECGVSVEVEEEKTGNAQRCPNSDKGKENIVIAGNVRLGHKWNHRCHDTRPPNY
jgi:hypothetical protein